LRGRRGRFDVATLEGIKRTCACAVKLVMSQLKLP
jgi:hypothetical protein